MKKQLVKVLHVIGIMNRGGAETMIMNLFRNINREKVQFDFVENSSERAAYDDEIESLGGNIYHCPHFNGRNYIQYKNWWKKFFSDHEGEYNIIHGHLGSTATIYLKIAKKKGLYIIAHSHNTNSNLSFSSAIYRMMSFETRYIANYFFGCSNKAGIDRYGKKIFQSDRYKTFPNGIDVNRFGFNTEVRKQIRQELGVESDSIIIGHVGRFERQKNHQFLIDIFKSFINIEKKSILLLVGDGYLKKAVESQINILGLSDRVVFTGVRSDVELFMQAMDIFVFPSLYEGLPLTLVEAQTSGLPCVISDKVPTESILTDNLVTVMELNKPSQLWAEHIYSRLNEKRFSRVDEITDKGYDITDTSKWLEEFYIEHSR